MALVPHKSDSQKEKEAREYWKQVHRKVLISGIQGEQDLETGIAYFHRGHDIYELNGTPIQHRKFNPLRRQARGVSDCIPDYRFDDHSAVTEQSIGALDKAKVNFWADQQEQDAKLKAEEEHSASGADNSEMEMKQIVRFNPNLTYAPFLDRHMEAARSYTPHDRALFLADSAPGSRSGSRANTPFPTRPPTPDFPRLRGAHASTSRLGSLLAASEADQPHRQYSKPIGSGRPRRASVALNEHHNAGKGKVYGCKLHGEEYDGETVTEEHISARPSGMIEVFPMKVYQGNRWMVDWPRLLEEEKKKKKKRQKMGL